MAESLRARLAAEQKELAKQVVEAPLDVDVKLIAGCDSSFLPGDRILSVFVVLEYPALKLIESRYHVGPVEMPYISGFLAFRELPNVLEAYGLLENEPDLILVDGHGVSHPRGMGLATHLGITLDKPTIGVAKKRLVGSFQEPALEKGSSSDLMRRKELIGKVLRSKNKVNPLFVSVGHLVTLEDALFWTKKCLTKYRLPEPTRWADKHSQTYKKEVPLRS